MSRFIYRYQLLPYAGPATRRLCPSCGYARSLVPYLDTRTREVLPAEYGRCNREVNCGYHHSPYYQEADGLTYKERTFQALIKESQGAGYPHPSRPVGRLATAQYQPAVPLSVLPAELLEQSMYDYSSNTFARLLITHFGEAVAGELLLRFQIGSSSYWKGACVFWLVDEQQRLRGGQVVVFDEQGHTVKSQQPDGTVRRRTGWVHTALSTHYHRRSQEPPTWLTAYLQQPHKSPCLFGLTQLTTAPEAQPVAVVEAPKTAVVCTPYFPGFIWLATGGLSYLSEARLQPLRHRSIVLFPDASTDSRAFDDWSDRAEQLRRKGFRIEVSTILERGTTEQQKAQGVDLADLLLSEGAGYPPSWDL